MAASAPRRRASGGGGGCLNGGRRSLRLQHQGDGSKLAGEWRWSHRRSTRRLRAKRAATAAPRDESNRAMATVGGGILGQAIGMPDRFLG
ncbi:hypothetical protein GUJ93_ZPchr0001g30088 [Zizania palustris]|uniref:Uncharacterized protein n=1 Tax=Zizania palustris TaxID=103762 RepID=A0A8J5S0W2_ZIZPA|nr:hypothetical protein GUJ93_ZPchr0001g30088 [Zizania palustris]